MIAGGINGDKLAHATAVLNPTPPRYLHSFKEGDRLKPGERSSNMRGRGSNPAGDISDKQAHATAVLSRNSKHHT